MVLSSTQAPKLSPTEFCLQGSHGCLVSAPFPDHMSSKPQGSYSQMFTGETPSPLSLVGRRGGKVTYCPGFRLAGICNDKFSDCFKCIENPFIIFM